MPERVGRVDGIRDAQRGEADDPRVIQVRPGRQPSSANTPRVAPTMIASPSGYANSTPSVRVEVGAPAQQAARTVRPWVSRPGASPPSRRSSGRDRTPAPGHGPAARARRTTSGYQASQNTSETLVISPRDRRVSSTARRRSPTLTTAAPIRNQARRDRVRPEPAPARQTQRGDPQGHVAQPVVEEVVRALPAEAESRRARQGRRSAAPKTDPHDPQPNGLGRTG